MNMFPFLRENSALLLYRYFPFFFPIQKSGPSVVGVTMLLCHKDVIMAIYCLQSLFYHLGYSLPIFIIDDGSLSKTDYEDINKFFSVTFENKFDVLPKIQKKYPNSHLLLKYFSDPQTNIKKMKLMAIFLSPFKKTICIEPDILFVNEPKEINDFILGTTSQNHFTILQASVLNNFIKENFTEVILRRLLYSQLGLNSHFLFNGGLMLINKEKLGRRELREIEKILKVSYRIGYQRFFYFDETLSAVIFGIKKTKQLPAHKYFNITDYQEYKSLKTKGNLSKAVMLHFTTYARKIILYQSLKLIFHSHFFRKNPTSISKKIK